MKDLYTEKIKWMEVNGYTEIKPIDYYRDLFPIGSFQKQKESKGDYMPNGILQFRNNTDSKSTMHNYIINDDLSTISKCINREEPFDKHDFVIISPIGYIGRNKTNKNARICYAVIIDVDCVGSNNLHHIIFQAQEKAIPMPTYINISGNGVHIVYILDEPIPLYSIKFKNLTNLKMLLTRLVWNSYTSGDPNIQYQGLVQGYRAAGTKTKSGQIVRSFKIGRKVNISELIDYADQQRSVYIKMSKPSSSSKNKKYYTKRISSLLSNKNLKAEMTNALCDNPFSHTLEDAKTKWPDWYERRIVMGLPPSHYHLNRKVYDWWLKTIKEKAVVGHRGKAVYTLAAYAQKCDIPYEEFEKDAHSLIPVFDKLSVEKTNRFTEDDIKRVLNQYKSLDLTRMSSSAISSLSGISIKSRPKSKHTKTEHLKKCREIRDSHFSDGENWYDGGGRPSKENIVKAYLKTHPDETNISAIAKACGVSRPTVYKYFS